MVYNFFLKLEDLLYVVFWSYRYKTCLSSGICIIIQDIFQAFLDAHAKSSHYMFQLKKCPTCNYCSVLQPRRVPDISTRSRPRREWTTPGRLGGKQLLEIRIQITLKSSIDYSIFFVLTNCSLKINYLKWWELIKHVKLKSWLVYW